MIWTMNRVSILANITADMERGTLDEGSFDYLKECALQLDRAMQILSLKMYDLGLIDAKARTHWCNCCAILPYVNELDNLKLAFPPDDEPEEAPPSA